MYLLFIWGWTYGFGWGKNPFLGAFEGVGPEILGAIPSNVPRYGLLPHPNPYVPPHIHNKYLY
jgi:hypothetical protein